ncbi:DUF3160 domain-containing protein [Candidatus Latescibacterota bacterium]
MKRFFLVNGIIALLSVTSAFPVVSETIANISAPVSTEFGTYQPVNVNVTPSVNPYTINEDLSNVVNIGNFELSSGVKEKLSSNGFAVDAGIYNPWQNNYYQFREIYDVYNECEDKGIPAFVTTDACLHTFHILYDYILRAAETAYFIDDLDTITQTMIRDMETVYETATESSVKQAALDNIDYLSVPYGLLNPEATDYTANAAEEIVRILGTATELSGSSLMSGEGYPYLEDYTQFKPRGHYTRTPELEKYFRAMKWYINSTFSLNLLGATQEGLRHKAVQALLLSRSLATAATEGGESVMISELWDNIYQPTAFFVGKMDDIDYLAYIETAKAVFGEDFLAQPSDVLADNALMDAFIIEALKLPGPKIFDSKGKGFRFMGGRFVPDAYMFNELTHTEVNGRPMPTGLDIMAVLGCDRAYEHLTTVYQDPSTYPDYDIQLNILKSEVMAYTSSTWAQNLYYNWLYSLSPLLERKGEGYPMFMQNDAWADKELNTALGSWAELRHDTILYVKETGTTGGPPPYPPLVMGYVEPNPELYARLAALADFMRRGLSDRNILDELYDESLLRFEEIMLTCKDIAVKELKNITPTTEEFVFICNFGGYIEELIDARNYETIDIYNESDDFMAVIADVFTDGIFTMSCLEVGVGHPLNIYVIAPVNGVPTLTKGGIFSYYEFTQPLSEGRLTDEEWWEIQASDNAKEMPEWTESFRADASTLKTESRNYNANYHEVTSVEETNQPEFSLLNNVPNPFNPSTVIHYTLAESGRIQLKVFNISGQMVSILIDDWQESGAHSIEWTPKGLSSGIYFIRLQHKNQIETIKVLYLK